MFVARLSHVFCGGPLRVLHGVRNANCSWSSVSPVAVNSKCCSAHSAAIHHAAYEHPMCPINTVQRGALGLRLLSMDYPPGGKARTFLKSSHSTGEYGTVRSALGTARASARSAAPALKLSSGVSARLSCARCEHFEIAELGKQLSMLRQSWSKKNRATADVPNAIGCANDNPSNGW